MKEYTFRTRSVGLTLRVPDGHATSSSQLDYYITPSTSGIKGMKAVARLYRVLALNGVDLNTSAYQQAFEEAVEALDIEYRREPS